MDLAGKSVPLAVLEVGGHLGLGLVEDDFFSGLFIVTGMETDAELDVVECGREILEVLLRGIDTRPQLDIDLLTIVEAPAFHQSLDDGCSGDRVLGENDFILHVHAIQALEVQVGIEVLVGVLIEFHNTVVFKSYELMSGGSPQTYELGVGARRCTSRMNTYRVIFKNHLHLARVLTINFLKMGVGVSPKPKARGGVVMCKQDSYSRILCG